MDDDLQTLLRSNPIFSALTKRAYKSLLSKFEKVELGKDEILYYQGDSSDSVEILLSGKLVAILTTVYGENKVIGYIEPGEIVGEIGALSSEPRSVTIKALKNCTLFKLQSETFVELCHQYPAVMFATINPIVTRSQQMIRAISLERFKKHIAIIPANDEISLQKFSEKMTEHARKLSSLILLSEYNSELSGASPPKLQEYIDHEKAKNIRKIRQKIIYILKPKETTLAKFCFEKIEMIYVVANGNSPVLLNNFVAEKINSFKTLKTKPELIIIHEDDTVLPRNTASWLKLADFGLHHHIRLNQSADFRRLIRFMRNKAVGVVLGGGGTRGWAHIGAIKALLEAGIPIDAIGGTSVGAIIGASYAITLSDEATLNQFRELIENSQHSVSWRNITWPAISLFNAKGLTLVLQKLFSDIQIEDLWLPYFCVSTNLANNTETIHETGLLWERTRASIAIPGVIPPMLLNGEIHVDGGLLNNLPVDVMRKMVTPRGSIVAVELGGNKDEHKYNFPPILPFWKSFLSDMGIGYDLTFPPFIDTFLKALLVGSSLKAQQNSLAANILVSLDLSRYPMLHSNKKQINKIIELGYDAMMLQIKNMQASKA